MVKLLFVYENEIATVELIKKVFICFEKRKDFTVTFKEAKRINLNDIINADILFFIRPNYYLALQIGKIARLLEKFIIVYCDDDLLNIKKSIHNLIWRKKSLIRILNLSDICCSPNRRITKKYKMFMKKERTFIFDTPIEKKDVMIKKFNESYFENDNIKILYAASRAHKIFFEIYINPILDKLVDKYGKRVSFTFIGVQPQINDKCLKKGNFIFYDNMPLNEYRKEAVSGNYDIGLAPLEKSEFTACKYFNKYLEYSMSGIMGIYTKTAPYTDIIEDRVNGYLVNNTSSEWFQALCYAIDNPKFRAKLISNAQAHILDKFDSEALYKKFVREIPECISNNKNGIKDSNRKINEAVLLFSNGIYKVERICEMIYKALQAYKADGLQGVFNKIKIHIN